MWIQNLIILKNGINRSRASIRPRKNQPFYHLFAENGHIFYVAYVSEQNLLDDPSEELPKHPEIKNLFSHFEDGRFVPLSRAVN
jgi:heat shock protein HspQ